MTTNQQRLGDLWRSPWWLVAGVTFGLGGYAATSAAQNRALSEALALKADKMVVEGMARDIIAVKALLCRQYPTDSYCERDR